MIYRVYENLLENFIKRIQSEGCYATEREIRAVAEDAISIIRKNSDATPEEIIESMIEDNLNELKEIMDQYPIPGYTVSVNVNDMHVKMLGGFMNSFKYIRKEDMREDALFDLASISKFYTELIAYRLIREGAFHFEDKIKDLDPRFINISDLTVEDVLSFGVFFKTDGKIAEKKTIDEALSCLYTMESYDIGKYNYNDLGMMLMKEVMESVTGLSFQELFNKYIVEPLNLENTYLKVPLEKVPLLTGSSNADIGFVNDPKANAVGGFSGHAGVFASNDDLVNLGYGVTNNVVLDKEDLPFTYTRGLKENRGIMGDTYIAHKDGVKMSYVDVLEPKTNFAIQGSTRVQANIGRTRSGDVIANTILFNPASMGMIKAYGEECKINADLLSAGKEQVELVKNYIYERNGQYVRYNLIDPRRMAVDDYTVCPVTTSNAKLTLKLRLLQDFMELYDKNYTKEVTLVKHM